MRRVNRARRALLRRCALAAAAMAGAALPAGPAAAAKARRIVSVGGALTEIVYALGAEAELVGVDTTSLYPAVAQKLPSVGYARTLSAEGVLSLAPSQLIATEEAGPAAVLRQVGAAGVAVAVLDANHRFEGLLERVRRVGEITGREAQAARLLQSLQRQWTAARQELARRGRKPVRILFVLAHTPNQIMVAGRGTSADAMLGYLEAVNVMGGPGGFSGYKPLTPEAVIGAQPELLLLTEQGLKACGGLDAVLRLPGLEQTAAGRGRRVVALEAMYLLGFGPRLPAALAALDAAVAKAMSA